MNFSNVSATQISAKMLFGYPMATFSAGEEYSGEDLQATILIKPQISLNFEDNNLSAFAYFAMYAMSSYGMIPLAGMGVGCLYYPSGFPIISSSEDQNSELIYKKFAPYFGMATGLSRMSISDTELGVSFLSNTVDITAIVGFDYPLSSSLVGGLEFSYLSSILGGSGDQGSKSNNASINVCFSISYYP